MTDETDLKSQAEWAKYERNDMSVCLCVFVCLFLRRFLFVFASLSVCLCVFVCLSLRRCLQKYMILISSPLTPADQGKVPGRGNTVVPVPGHWKCRFCKVIFCAAGLGSKVISKHKTFLRSCHWKGRVLHYYSAHYHNNDHHHHCHHLELWRVNVPSSSMRSSPSSSLLPGIVKGVRAM